MNYSHVHSNNVVLIAFWCHLDVKIFHCTTLCVDYAYATALIDINQYNTDKQNLEKKIRDVDKKYQT